MSQKPFYGWWITSMGVLGNALQGGLIFWSMGLFTSTFEEHFGASRARVTLIETFISVSVNVMSPFLGVWVDRGSARFVVALGAASLGTGLILISFAGTLLHIWFVFMTLIPLAALSLGVLPSSALISRWFRRRRGLALGISVTGSSIGGMLAPPLLTWLFLAYGWRTALLITGIAVLCTAPVFYKVLVDHPEQKGMEQEPEDPAAELNQTAADEVDWSIKEILRTPALWLQTLVSGSLLCVTLGMLANLSLHAKDLGFEGQQAAWLYTIIAFCSFAGKVSFGHLTDKIGIKPTGGLTISLMVAAMLAFLTFESYPGLIAASVLLGLAAGGVSPIWTTMIARGFGAKSFGRAIGLQNPLHIPITAPSAPLAGYISDTTGSYDLMFMVYIALMGVASIGLYALRQPVPPNRDPDNTQREQPTGDS